VRLLLDTCSFLWLAFGVPDLSETARRACADPDNDLFLSPASAWEIAVKWHIGKLELRMAPQLFVPRFRAAHGIEELPVTEAAALHVSSLPPLHRDPFDRLLICQAIEEGLAILTPDAAVRAYPVRCIW